MAPSLGPRKSRGGGLARIPFKPPRPVSTAVRAGKSARSKATAALKLVRQLAGQVEVKTFSFNATAVDMLTGATQINSCVDIAQGDGDNGRTGVSVHLKRIDFSLRMLSLTQPNTAWRVMVVQDNSNDTGIVGTDVLQTSNTLSQYNPINQDRFKVLHDQVLQMNDSFSGQDFALTHKFSVTNFLEGGKVNYTGAGGGTCDRNKVYVIVIADWADSTSMTRQGWAASEALFTLNGMTYYTDP